MASTTKSSPGLDPAAIERVVVDACVPAPDTELVDRPGWTQLRTPSIADHTANGVYLASLSPDEADARIEAVKHSYLSRGAEFRWFVGPSSAPADLGERLERAGLRLLGTTLGMHMAVPRELPALPEGVELREVGAEDVERFVELSMRAWQRGPRFGELVRDALERALACDENAQRSWLVWARGEPVGTTTVRLLPGIGYMQGGAVVPERRGEGLYRAMLHHRLAVLRELGIAHAVIWADERSSAPIAQSVGFVTVCRGLFYEWRHDWDA